MTKLGRITNGALHALQRTRTTPPRQGTSSRRIAGQVLPIWTVRIKRQVRATFGSGNIPTGNTRPSNYFTGEPKPTDVIIQIFHTADGRMVALNFGKNGYMVTMVSGRGNDLCEGWNRLPS